MRDVSLHDLEDWKPGDRYLRRPVGFRLPHWHEITRMEFGGDLPVIHCRCLARRDCGR